MNDPKKDFQENSVAYFQGVLTSMGIPMSQFKVKSAFYPKVGEKLEGISTTDRIVGMFDSEAGRGVDIYMELYNKDKDGNITPLEGRPLFRYKYREDYKDVYPWNGTSYTVKLSDLEVINRITLAETGRASLKEPSAKPKLSTSNVFDELTDVSVSPAGIHFPSAEKKTAKTMKVSELTVQEFAALLWRMPISGNEEIDGLIKYYK